MHAYRFDASPKSAISWLGFHAPTPARILDICRSETWPNLATFTLMKWYPWVESFILLDYNIVKALTPYFIVLRTISAIITSRLKVSGLELPLCIRGMCSSSLFTCLPIIVAATSQLVCLCIYIPSPTTSHSQFNLVKKQEF